MLKYILKQTVIYLLIISIAFGSTGYAFALNAKAADDNDGEIDYDPEIPLLIKVADQKKYSYIPTKDNQQCKVKKTLSDSLAYKKLLETMAQFSDQDSLITFDDLLTNSSEQKIIMKQSDLAALKSLSCLSNILPNFDEDFDALYKNLPKDQTEIVDKNLQSNKDFKTPIEYLKYLKIGRDNLTSTERFDNLQLFNRLAEAARKNVGENKIRDIWADEEDNLKKGKVPSVDLDTLVCVTGIGRERIINYVNHDKPYLAEKLKESIDSLNIDVRVLKTLVYLITPKNQGGAGHWRIRVNRILQRQDKSTESDSVVQTLANSQKSVSKGCSDEMTAADCGKQKGTTPDLEIEDKNGAQYEAYLTSLTEKEDSFVEERNLSSHAEGQAIDISEIDDIRCTKVVKKNTGGTKKYKQPIQPIKLAWQTTDGWNASGERDPFDMMSLLKSAASESVNGLLGNLNSDISSYEGDLSKANFEDIIQILGKSLLGNVLESKSLNFAGFNVEDTLKKLGSTYVADYLGLPREIFIGQNLSDIEKIKYTIGRSAIEKKLGIPFGSLSGSDLPSTLIKIGQRKLEHEMNLNAGDLDAFVTSKNDVFANYVGAKVIEKDLNLAGNSWPKEAVTFGNLSDKIGSLRSTLIKNNPGLIDNDLNLGAGTANNFILERINSADFAAMVGKKRLDDTLYGLKYFSMNNGAYQLPGPTEKQPDIRDTWEGALSGDHESLSTIGIYTLARLLADDSVAPKGSSDQSYKKIRVIEGGVTQDINPDEFGRFIFRQWLRGNIQKSSNECSAPKLNKTLDYEITPEGQIIFQGSSKISNALPAIPITQKVEYSLVYSDQNVETRTDDFIVTEEKSMLAGLEKLDLQRIFGCSTANNSPVFKRIGSQILYTGVANKLINKEDKTKIDLLNTNPELRISNSTIAFYTSRLNQAQKLLADIKGDWKIFASKDSGFENTYTEINDLISNLKNVFESSDANTIKIQNTWEKMSSATSQIDSIVTQLDSIKNFTTAKAEANNKIDELNSIIFNANELLRISSEIISGREIPTSDSLKLSQINSMDLTSNDSGGGNNNISPFKASSLIFGFLAGNVSPTDLFISFGANMAESKLGLPSNSLLYLVENFEKKGMGGSDAFFKSIGQAKIEEVFSMPPFYFQEKNSVSTMADFATNASELLKYADKTKIDEAVNSYLASKLNKAKSPLGELPTDITGINSSNKLLNVLSQMQAENWPDYDLLVASARDNWKQKQDKIIEQFGSKTNANSFNTDSIVQNIKDRGFNDALKSAESDLMMRLGLGSGNYEALKSGGVLAWQKALSEALSIDNLLGLEDGDTKSLFTKDKNLYSVNLSSDEQNLLENNLKISKNVLDIYTKLVSGKILPSELDQYNDDVLNPDYVFVNPYADTASDSNQCPVSYTKQDGFSINETSLENNSFCYYDKKGRHCFKSPEEAQRYSLINKDQRYGNILEELAQRLADSASDKSQISDIRNNLLSFITDKNVQYAFGNNKEKTQQLIDAIGNKNNIDKKILSKLFIKDSTNLPVPNYKLLVGRAVAEKVINYKIFDASGLNIDPSLFGPDDLYNVLGGDFTSLYRISTNYIDQELNLKPGTVLSVFNAKDQISRNCTLNQVGGSILGSLIGLDYFPLKGEKISDFVSNFGQSKVEQSLNLPRGTFFGATFGEAFDRSRAINIALSFNIPLSDDNGEEIFDEKSLVDIFGDSYAKKIKNTGAEYKARQIQNHLRGSLVINGPALTAINNIDQKIKDRLKSALAVAGKSQQNNSGNIEFYQQLNYLDKQFGISSNSTYDLLAGLNSMTPDKYNQLVGEQTGLKLVGSKIGESLGLDQNQSETALTLVKNLNNIFKCQGKIIETDGQKVCRTGSATDEWYGKWDKLYDHLNQIFTFQLDERANLPEGTFQRIIADPMNSGTILMEIGAQKIDYQFGLDSSKAASFTGLYSRVVHVSFGPTGQTKDCLNEASSDPTVSPLDTSLHNAEAKLAELEKQKPVSKNGQKTDDYINSSEYKKWQEDLKVALTEVQQARTTLSKEINDRYNICKAAISQNPSGNVDGSFKEDIVAWGKEVLSDKIHDFIYNVKANYNNKEIRVGVDMPLEDIANLVSGDMKYFQIAAISLGVNYVMAPIDNIRKSHCSANGDDECKTAIPQEMRIAYDDIKTSIIGAPDVEAYQRAAWVDVNGIYSNPETRKVCNGDNCPKTGSGNFGDALIDSLGKNYTETSTSTSVTNQVDEQYNYSPENLQSKIDELNTSIVSNNAAAPAACQKSTNQASGDQYNKCVSEYNKNNGDPEGRLDRLSNPESYYQPSGANFTPKNGELLTTVQKSIRKASLDNLQFKMLDIALWKLDENSYPGMARDLLQGNAEIKAAALARYIKTGLTNGHLLGKNFEAIKNVDEWIQVAKFAKDFVAGDKDAFTTFASGNGFDFFSNFLSDNSEEWFGFPISGDLAKGLLVGVGTGDWGLKSITLDNIVKGDSTTHNTIVADGSTMSLPTVGGVLTTVITTKLFTWADKTLGLKAGQSLEIFKLGYDLYKSWKIYEEISRVKDIAQLSSNAKEFMELNKISDLAEAKDAAKQAFTAAETLVVYKIVSIAVEKLLDKQIAGVEDSLGMIPGTLTPLITVAVYNLVVAPLLGLGPVGWTAAVVIALAGYLLGQKIYYYCTADGYYPKIEAPQPKINDTTGMGVWGGQIKQNNNINELLKKKMVEASQNKARKLIENMMRIQNYEKYNTTDNEPIYPIQIMTGRKEDVDYFDQAGMITVNMCQPRLGNDSISCGGICGSKKGNGCESDTRMGIWQNPQTVAWTHIGF